EFERYRQAITAGLEQIDLYAMHDRVSRIAVPLINSFCQDGHADLLQQYVFPLVFATVNEILSCPPEIGQQVAAGTAALLEGVEAEKGNQMLGEALQALVTLRRAEPRHDITTALLRHPAGLDDSEVSTHISQV